MKNIRIVLIICLMISALAACSDDEKADTETAAERGSAETGVLKKDDEAMHSAEFEELIVNLTPRRYTYEDLEYDIEQIEKLYKDHVEVIRLCDTADGRGIYDIIVGDPQGEDQILIFGAIHAREYITSQIVMRQMCECIDAKNGLGGEYGEIPVKELLDGITIHFIPMSNPDGVTISQIGAEGLSNAQIRMKVSEMIGDDHTQWKANAAGVDLNRNFDAGWDEYKGADAPSSERYKGEFPGSEPETLALIDITQKYHFKRTVSYHTCGAVIYWYYKQDGDLLNRSQDFANRISIETGYPLYDDYTSLDAAGYKDWAVYKMGIPSITIEVGNENGEGIVNPVSIRNFDDIWQRNKNVVYAAAYDLKYAE